MRRGSSPSKWVMSGIDGDRCSGERGFANLVEVGLEQDPRVFLVADLVGLLAVELFPVNEASVVVQRCQFVLHRHAHVATVVEDELGGAVLGDGSAARLCVEEREQASALRRARIA